jgi:two-component system, chemotaxis family, CheB/CheR fusion protein
MSFQPAPDSDPQLEALLTHIKHNRGFDFTGYKRASLMRRIQKRMQGAEIDNYTDYIDYLEVHPDEFAQLFDTILINVTSFFRDTSAWDYVAKEIIPQILSHKKNADPIRVWSAGCASGEEPYTIAILLAEALGIERFRERVKIYASDVDEDALSRARQATYSKRDVAEIPADLLEKYFDHKDTHYAFNKELRRSVIFGRHDLIQDAPISRIDLLTCRNALMYFNSEAQARILGRFHFALNENGFMLLGKAEMLFTHGILFTPFDVKRRIFVKVPRITMRDRLRLMQNGHEQLSEYDAKHLRLHDVIFDANALAQIVVDNSGALILLNERARTLFGLTNKELTRPLGDLEISYQIKDLRKIVNEALSERRPITIHDVSWESATKDKRTFEVEVLPLNDGTGSPPVGASITFTDVTHYKRLQRDLEHSHQELETAYEELQSTNEEMETTNEELQSTIEELETTNEELQSTNEELETINEEIQSTNEELQTINGELRRRTDDLNMANSFLESIFTSMRGGVVVVDRDLRVQIWNDKAEDMWGLRPAEVMEKNFLNLDIGLPVEQLRQAMRISLTGDKSIQEAVLTAINRRGKTIECKVVCSPLYNPGGDVRGVILIMEEISSNAEKM